MRESIYNIIRKPFGEEKLIAQIYQPISFCVPSSCDLLRRSPRRFFPLPLTPAPAGIAGVALSVVIASQLLSLRGLLRPFAYSLCPLRDRGDVVAARRTSSR